MPVSATSAKIFCRLLVCGGGAGGCSIAAKFAPNLGHGGCVVVEPKDIHYYQPMWTLVGGGMKTVEQSGRPMASVLPKTATWIKDSIAEFHPEGNKVVTKDGKEINYEFMVVALGIDLCYGAVPGLEEALSMKNSGVCSNYHHKYVNRTFQCVKGFQRGNAIFTLPNSPIKCPGAPQKACYISESLLRKFGKRDNAKVKYKTTLPVIFIVKEYADRLWSICKERDIEVGLRQDLIEVKPDSKEAVFRNLDNPSELTIESFEMLHVCPPMSAPSVMKTNSQLTDSAGFLSINKDSLQHTKFDNIFGIGDCTNLPTPRTAAGVATQNGVLRENLSAAMGGKQLSWKYNGYTSCPLVTGVDKCILSEFDYNLQPLETFPMDQGKERYSSFLLTSEMMPTLYWQGLLRGYWDGPSSLRSLFHLGFK